VVSTTSTQTKILVNIANRRVVSAKIHNAVSAATERVINFPVYSAIDREVLDCLATGPSGSPNSLDTTR
jgi:hypothetical protein